MIRIAVVDDEKHMLNKVARCIDKIFTTQDDIEVMCFEKGETFLNRMKNDYLADILLSDIELPDIHGVEMGRIVREKYPALYLIFLTSHSEFAVESYKIDAYQYIMKEHMEERLPQILRRLAEKLKKENIEYRMVGTNTSKVRVNYRDIISIHKDKGAKYVTYITNKGELRERTTIESVKEELHSNDFVFTERGLIINMKHIVRLTGNSICMDNGEQITVSRNHIVEVKKQINRCWRNNK